MEREWIMLQFLDGLLHNKVLLCAITGWFVAQVCKALLFALMNRRFQLERLVGSGGMPSSHAATVLAMVVASGVEYGPESFPFAISALVAIIVIHDARGVRLETGRHAEVLNRLMHYGDLKELFEDEAYLKELVGHTPFQVLVGAILGAVTGLIMSLYVV